MKAQISDGQANCNDQANAEASGGAKCNQPDWTKKQNETENLIKPLTPSKFELFANGGEFFIENILETRLVRILFVDQGNGGGESIHRKAIGMP
jgi:hypothetical protein